MAKEEKGVRLLSRKRTTKYYSLSNNRFIQFQKKSRGRHPNLTFKLGEICRKNQTLKMKITTAMALISLAPRLNKRSWNCVTLILLIRMKTLLIRTKFKNRKKRNPSKKNSWDRTTLPLKKTSWVLLFSLKEIEANKVVKSRSCFGLINHPIKKNEKWN